MSYNHAKLRSLQISQEVQPLSSRNPNSSRTKPISLLSSHILSQGLTSSSIQNLDDNISSITTERQRASVSTKRSQLIGTTNVDKENINSDADDLFDNFDRCYRASYSTAEKSVKENKSLPVCRDLLSEFAADATKASSGLSGVKTPLAFGNSSHFQRPKEFQVSKAGRYFDMKTPSNNNVLTKMHNIGFKNEEDVENEDEEHRQINVKNILTRRSTNYEMEQKSLNKLKKGDYRIEIPNQRRVLDDVTNNTERHTHKPSVHEGVESNRINFMEMFTRRGTVGKQTLVEKKKNSVVQNGQLETKKINIPGMLALASLQKRENLQPPTRNSYNGRGSESHRVISHKEVEKPASVPRKDQNMKYNSKPKAVSGRNSARLEHENKGSRGSVKVYESLMRYFEIAKKELSRSKSNSKRSSSENRR